ncbi:patched family protein [Cryptosporidium andersoni]|uniref:Patched family protein n=1 Tax=Cryptosporidium andersoni TaxID=117008 RepID=A0A1J4MSA0_9CRYT|nr:patched family protein [Cryptosporidium andersoni]
MEERSEQLCVDVNKKKPFKKITTFLKQLANIQPEIVEFVATKFGIFGGIIYENPWWFILGSILITLICCIGFIPGIPKWVDSAEQLYSLPYSLARDHGILHTKLFSNIQSRTQLIIVTSNTPGENVLTWEFLEIVSHINKLVRGESLDAVGGRRVGVNIDSRLLGSSQNTKFNSEIDTDPFHLPNDVFLTYNDICTRTSFETCSVQSVIEAGILDMKALLDGKPPELYILGGFVFNLRKQAFLPDYILGKMKTIPCIRTLPTDLVSKILRPELLIPSEKGPGFSDVQIDCIIGAEAFLMAYEIFDDKTDANMIRNMMWEQALINILKENRDWGRARLTFSAFRSRDDELKASTSENSDILLVGLTFALLFFYVGSANFSFDLYKMKTYSGLAGLFAALLGLASGMGLMSICGVSFVPTVLVTPFLIMGAAVNYLFVIVNAYSTGYTITSTKERCMLTLQDSVIGISITMCTGLVSFSIGAVGEPYMSIRNFCIFSAASIIFTYIYVFIFMFPVLCLDAKRESIRRLHFFKVPKLTDADIWAKKEALEGRSLPIDKATSFAIVSYNLSRILDEYNIKLYPVKDSDYYNKSLTQRIIRNLFHLPMKQNNLMLDKNKIDTSTSESQIISSSYTDCSNISQKFYENRLITRELEYEQQDSSRNEIFTEDLSCYNQVSNIEHLLQTLLIEPPGTVGRSTRRVMLHTIGPLMATPLVKFAVLILWITFLSVSIYGFTKMESGLDLRDLAPKTSYLQGFDRDFIQYFGEYDVPTDVYFPETLEWWKREVQERIFDFVLTLEKLESTKRVIDPLQNIISNPNLAKLLRGGSKEIFQTTLYDELYNNPDSNYKQFAYDFVWKGKELVTYRIRLFVKGMQTSQQKADWMSEIRAVCEAEEKHPKLPFKVVAYNYMMLFYESDLSILSECFSNMLSCGIAIELITLMLIPEVMSGLFVIVLMACIDIGLFGFMYYWNVKLNMVSMINLLLSMGFAVDYSTLMTHTFSHCYGQTRNHRMIECLGLMGAPVCHGAMSTFLGIVVLSGSTSYIFTVFFKMMVMVVGFGFFHGIIVLPVLLSIVGRLTGNTSDIELEMSNWLRNGYENKKKSCDCSKPTLAILSRDFQANNNSIQTFTSKEYNHTVDFIGPNYKN